MGGVPKKRHTKSSRNQRRMHLFLKSPSLSKCLKCGKEVLPHRVCAACGYYKGREVINVMAKLDRKERKSKEKEIRDHEKEGAKEVAPEKTEGSK
ncbi:MAG: 50S ribosomal protein L32 [Candidatus Nealsonbacteria bacterium]|nr:50S ribosomal protein L32 [Candidatus Nealsonbacteria bacterium]